MGGYNKITESLINQRFYRLTVIEVLANKDGRAARKCLCDCGKYVEVLAKSLLRGNTKSCGCLSRDSAKERFFKHGGAINRVKTREYRIWKAMKTRCLNEKQKSYKNYGGRGIKICSKWLKDFKAFLEDMGLCPKGYTIERINNDGDYEPDNCKWATYKEQAINRRIRRDVLGKFCKINENMEAK